MATCKNCSKPIELKQGRRPREFCDNNNSCKQQYYLKNKKDKTHKLIPIEEWKKIEIKLGEITTLKVKEVPISQLREYVKNDDNVIPESEIKELVQSSIPPIPVRTDFDNSIDFAAAKNEWKKKYNP